MHKNIFGFAKCHAFVFNYDTLSMEHIREVNHTLTLMVQSSMNSLINCLDEVFSIEWLNVWGTGNLVASVAIHSFKIMTRSHAICLSYKWPFYDLPSSSKHSSISNRHVFARAHTVTANKSLPYDYNWQYKTCPQTNSILWLDSNYEQVQNKSYKLGLNPVAHIVHMLLHVWWSLVV